MDKNVRVIALYLPQFHPIPENDLWWGKGFTEWTNVGKAKPLFRGHKQPYVPADLGYYDLRVSEVRIAQAELARENGVEGFCYWHYWFGNGKRLLERPFLEVLQSGEPDFPFCLAWANESWKGFHHGLDNKRAILIEQYYPGVDDYTKHFYEVLPAFKDSRYITIEGKPLFMIYKPLADPEITVFIKIWRKLAIENGLSGIYFIGHCNLADKKFLDDIFEIGVDAVNPVRLTACLFHKSIKKRIISKFNRVIRNMPLVHSYSEASKYFLNKDLDSQERVYPSIIPRWDHTPRSGRDAFVLTGSTSDKFKKHFQEALSLVENKAEEHKIIFLKSWNEWAEGNFVEPDLESGKSYLEVFKDLIFRK